MKKWMMWWILALFALALGSCGPGPMGPGHMGGMMGRGMMSAPAGPPPAVTPVATATPGGETTVSYSRQVQPLFDRSCVACHGGQMGLCGSSAPLDCRGRGQKLIERPSNGKLYPPARGLPLPTSI